jgi:hypothetical protein
VKKLLTAFLAICLTACAVPNYSLGGPPPVPLAATTIDDSGLSAAWKSFDLALDAIDLLRNSGIIKVGSPKAVRIADGIDAVTAALTAAESAANAASNPTDYAAALVAYRKALSDAKIAMLQLRAALKG